MKTCVIIINYNSGDLLAKCLRALALQSLMPEKILVVDNHSSDHSLENLPDIEALEILKLKLNTGFARANNIALATLNDCKYIALLNPDAFPEQDWLKHLVDAAEQMPEYAFFGSTMLNAANPELVDGTGDVYHMSGLAWRAEHGCRSDASHKKKSTAEIFSACAGAALYKKACFDIIGGFDEDFFCYMEDVDFGFRLQLAGYKGVSVPNAIVNHIGSAITGKNSDFSIYYGHRNLVWTYVKNMPGLLFWLFLPLHILLNIFSIFWFLYKGQGRIILLAKWDALKGIPEMWCKRRVIQANRVAELQTIWRILDRRLLPVRGKK